MTNRGFWWSTVLFLTACGSTPAEPDSGAAAEDAGGPVCQLASDCSDGLYCNGLERCAPEEEGADALGCVAGAAPCTGACDEDADACEVDACAEPDQDGDGADSIACGGDDCDDSDPLRYPSAVEVCDALNRDEDCNPDTIGERDADGDGAVSAACCNGDTCGTDCDDARPSVSPTATEVCDGYDNDCDASTDEGVLRTFYVDVDGDGFGDAEGMTREGCFVSSGFVEDSTDCDDGARSTSPAAAEICGDAIDNDCDENVDESGSRLLYADDDRDGYGDGTDTLTVTDCSVPEGYVTIGGDCNDGDGDINPGADDPCDRRDTNCSLAGSAAGGLDLSEDFDGDGHASPLAGCTGGFPLDDCDDADPFVYPGAAERCDGRDSICADGGAARPSEDVDGDSFAPIGADCIGGFPRADCADDDDSIFPTAAEICDGRDNNCGDGGGVVEAEDADGDGFAAPDAPCTGGPFPKTDCDDAASSVYPGAPEICDGRYSDCTMGGAALPAEDLDGDGHTDSDYTGCSGGPFPQDDCDDTRTFVHGGSYEMCDGVLDEDCDASVDEAVDGAAFCGPGASCEAGTCHRLGPSVGLYGACAVTEAAGGELQCWGSEGWDDGASNAPPTAFALPGGVLPNEIDTRGYLHRCARAGGQVFCWGDSIAGSGPSPTEPVDDALGRALDDAVELASGESFSCARRLRGQVACWGQGLEGQLGSGANVSRGEWADVVGIADAVSVSAGRDFACAVRATGAVLCWGRGLSGQLGDGGFASRNSPVPVSGLTDAVQVGLGDQHACAVRATGEIACWGTNGHGELGDGSRLASGVPVAVDLAGIDAPAVEVRAGDEATCARFADGAVACWGWTENGRLGGGQPHGAPDVLRPALIEGLTATALSLSSSREESTESAACARRTDGAVVCWGASRFGRLGRWANGFFSEPVPSRLPGRSLDCSGRDSFGGEPTIPTCVAINDENEVVYTGGGPDGSSVPVPTVIEGLPGAPSQVAVGAILTLDDEYSQSTICALVPEFRDDGASPPRDITELYCTDLSHVFSARTPESDAVRYDLLRMSDAVGCISQRDPALWLGDAESAFPGLWYTGDPIQRTLCWGRGDLDGKLGTSSAQTEPGRVRFDHVVQDLSLGPRHGCAVSATAGVEPECWGDTPGTGRDGFAEVPALSEPSAPEPLFSRACADGCAQVACGSGYTCHRDSDGDVSCWGQNTSGEAGSGSETGIGAQFSNSNIGQTVGPLLQIAAGGTLTCGIVSSGELYCAGRLGFASYQWFDPTFTGSSAAIEGIRGATAVLVEDRHVCVTTSDGVLCWGTNTHGQLGTGWFGTDWGHPLEVPLLR